MNQPFPDPFFEVTVDCQVPPDAPAAPTVTDRLLTVLTDRSTPPGARVEEVLRLGCDWLGMERGRLAAGAAGALPPLEEGQSLLLHEVAGSDYAGHDALAGSGTYIGVPLSDGEGPVATLTFSSGAPRGRPFGEDARGRIERLAAAMETVLAQAGVRRDRDRATVMEALVQRGPLQVGLVELHNGEARLLYLSEAATDLFGGNGAPPALPDAFMRDLIHHGGHCIASGEAVTFQSRLDGPTRVHWLQIRLDPVTEPRGAPRFSFLLQEVPAVTGRGGDEEAEQELQLLRAELERIRGRLYAQTVVDGLTGLANRRAFEDRLARELKRVAAGGAPLSVLLVDVDHLAQYNHRYGVLSGDAVLVQIAELLDLGIRPSDLVARYEGQVFAVLLRESERDGALLVADRLRRALHATPWPDRQITASIGVATVYSGDAPSVDETIFMAREAVIHAKARGRDLVIHSDRIGPVS